MHENCKYRHVSGFKDNYVCIAQQAGLLCCCDDAGGKKKGAVGLQPVQDSICEFHSHKQRTSSDQGKKNVKVSVTNKPSGQGRVLRIWRNWKCIPENGKYLVPLPSSSF